MAGQLAFLNKKFNAVLMEIQPAGIETVDRRRHEWLKLPRRALALGTTALALAAGTWAYLDRSGEVDHFYPTETQPVQIDDVTRVATWNMHGQARTREDEIGSLARGKDAVALQEVTHDDAVDLSRHFPAWHVVFALGDAKQHTLDGGYGNILMTRQAPRDIESKVLTGTTFLQSAANMFEGFWVDVAEADTSLNNTKDGLQESRVALAETIKMESGGQDIDVRLITAHITGNQVENLHARQFKQLLGFIKGNMKRGRPTFVCGDFNSHPQEAVGLMAQLGFSTNSTIDTSVEHKTIDYCFSDGGEAIEGSRVRFLPDYVTDHLAGQADFYGQPAPAIFRRRDI